MKAKMIMVVALAMAAMIHSPGALAQTPPPNLPGPGGYKPIPNFTGTNAGEEFRGAINDRFSGVEPISPRLVNLPFADLPAERDGLSLYCTDCQKSSPCSAGGNGAFAFGQNGQWSCTGPGNALLNGQNAGGDLVGSFPNPSVETVLGGKSPVTQSMSGAVLNGLAGAKSDGSDSLSGFSGARDNEVNVMAFGASGAGILATTATGAAGSGTITVANAAGWKAGQGIIVHHGGAAVTLSAPSAPVLTVFGTPGASTCTYAVRALTAKRGYSAASPRTSVSNCTTSLSLSGYVRITWSPVPNAWGYEVIRTAPSTGLIAVTTATAAVDVGYNSYGMQPFAELPLTADGSSGADWLQTTVSAVNGSTLTLSTNLVTALTGYSYVSHDDTAPITNAWNSAIARGAELYFPAGAYFFAGPPLNTNGWSSPRIKGAHDASRIYIADNQYLILQTANQFVPGKIEDMEFVGGLGVYHNTSLQSETNPDNAFEFINDRFFDFTGVATGFEPGDVPRLKWDHCFFQALDENRSIGILVPGSWDNQILNTQFQNVRIGIKTPGGDGITIAHDTFLSALPIQNPQAPRIGVWEVPSIQGSGELHINDNKFGNENLSPDDIRIAILDDGGGADESTRMPSFAAGDDMSMAAGAATLTSATQCPFTSTMCQGGAGCTGNGGNWSVVMQGAGRALNAVSDALTTTITGFSDACHVTLAANATVTMSNTIARMAPPMSAYLDGFHITRNDFIGVGFTGSAPSVVSNGEPEGGEFSYNSYTGGLPSEMWEQMSAPGLDPARRNIAANNLLGTLNGNTPPGQNVLCNVADVFNAVVDPANYVSRTLNFPMAWQYPLTGDVGATDEIPSPPAVLASWGGVGWVSNVTDSFGKTNGDAAEYISNGTGGGFYWNGAGASYVANVPLWFYFELHSGSAAPLNRLLFSVVDASSGTAWKSWPITIQSGWQPYLFMFIPNTASVTWGAHWDMFGSDAGRVQIGRFRVWQGWSPPPMVDQNINGELAVNQTNGTTGLAIRRATDTAPGGDLQDFKSRSGTTVAGTDVWGNSFTRIATIAYAASMTPDLSHGAIQVISATDANAFTIGNPINETPGINWTLRLENASGGSLGTVTFGSGFRVGTFAAPAAGKSRIFNCLWDGTSNWCVENGGDL